MLKPEVHLEGCRQLNENQWVCDVLVEEVVEQSGRQVVTEGKVYWVEQLWGMGHVFGGVLEGPGLSHGAKQKVKAVVGSYLDEGT